MGWRGQFQLTAAYLTAVKRRPCARFQTLIMQAICRRCATSMGRSGRRPCHQFGRSAGGEDCLAPMFKLRRTNFGLGRHRSPPTDGPHSAPLRAAPAPVCPIAGNPDFGLWGYCGRRIRAPSPPSPPRALDLAAALDPILEGPEVVDLGIAHVLQDLAAQGGTPS